MHRYLDSYFLLMNWPLYHYETTFFISSSILGSDIYSDINIATAAFY